MRASFSKIALLFLALFFLAGLTFLTQAQTEKTERETNASDTAEVEEGKFPFEAEEISISESEIYIRTKDGKKLILGGKESVDEIIVDVDRIRIGDMEIDLRGLEDLDEISPIRIPKVKISPRVYTTGEDIVKFGSDVVVEEDEKIDGDVVALGGGIEVRGIVTGNVVAIGGDVDVFPTGMVEGDAVSIGGNVIKRGGAVIEGEKVSIGFFRSHLFRFPFMPPPFHIPLWATFARILKIIFFIFLGIVVISILPKNVAKVKEKVKHDFLKSGLVGLAAEILIIPIFILLIITIIGIPVALLVEPLLILAAVILGYTGICLFVGEKLQEHTSLKPDTKIMILVIGILAVELVPLLARVLGIFGGPFSPFAWIITFLGWMIGYVVITVGLGAAVLTRLGTRPKDISPAPVAVSATETDSNEKPSN